MSLPISLGPISPPRTSKRTFVSRPTRFRIHSDSPAETASRSVGVAKIELRKIAVKVLLRAVLIDALHAAFEDAEIAFDGVGVDSAPHILALGMINGLVSAS